MIQLNKIEELKNIIEESNNIVVLSGAGVSTASGIKIYNDAYISCANKAFGYDRKHDNHLALLNKMFNEDRIQGGIIMIKIGHKREGGVIRHLPVLVI